MTLLEELKKKLFTAQSTVKSCEDDVREAKQLLQVRERWLIDANQRVLDIECAIAALEKSNGS